MQAAMNQNGIDATQTRTLSLALKSLIIELVKKTNKEQYKDEILDIVTAFADEVKNTQILDAKAIKDEIEERFKNELATKDFVRAEIAETKQSIIKWVLGVGISAVVILISANFAMIMFLVETLR